MSKQNFARVRCDSCKRYMNIGSIKESLIANAPITKARYFECSKCGAKYLICVDDFQTVEYKRKIRRLQDLKISENHDEIKKLKKKASEYESKLRERHKSELEKEFFNIDGQIAVIENVYEK